MSEPRKIVYGDTEYSTIHADWLTNGSPAKFCREGSWGGAYYHVLDTSATYPDFYQVMSLGPTTFNENSASLRPTQEGWYLQNRNYHTLKMKQRHDGRLKVTAPEIPNKLSPSETIE